MELEKYLDILTKKEATDLYLTVNLPPCLRINAQMLKINEQKLTVDALNQMIDTLLDAEQQQVWQTTHELNLGYSSADGKRYRINLYQQRNQPAIVVRPIRTQIPSMESLGLPSSLQELINTKHGLILFVGSTGVGKSTSMASLIDYRNQNTAGHIITVEDPIEYLYEHKKCIISQREVGTDTESFAAALKNMLRESPDIIQIGEIRDRDTMEHALNFAETGHLVLSTLHANNANQAIERIVSFFPKDEQQKVLLDLSLNLLAIVAQRMLTDIDGNKVVAFELLRNTPHVADLIKNENISGLKDAMRKGNQQGLFTFDQSLLQLFKDKRITRDEALRNADSANDLELQIKLQQDEIDAGDLKIR